MKLALALVAAAAVLVGCGSKKPDLRAQANVQILNTIPVYPGSSAGKTTTSGSSNSEFGARDFQLPATARAATVLAFYEQRLPKRGWKIVGTSVDKLRARRGHARLSVSVRGRTLEVIASSRGA